MICASVCSGIGAPEAAWHPLGWRCAFASEIDPFARAVYAHRFPHVPLLGDFTKIEGWHEPIDLLVGGTPCQSFSVAGKRLGLDDPRGNLAIEFLALARRLRPRWIVWENVPGVLSSNDGRDFGAFLGLLGELGYGWAYRILDAQYFGVPQRRRRVILVGHIGGAWQRCAAVLFEPEGLRGDPAPRRETRERTARPIAAGSPTGSGYRNDADPADNLIVAHTLRAEGFDASEDGTGRGIPLAFDCKAGGNTSFSVGDVSGALRGEGHGGGHAAVAVDTYNASLNDSIAHTVVRGRDNRQPHTLLGNFVRRLTPRECERLQGFPDDWTLVPWRKGMAPDGPRYRALGNSMAVPVMRWIGERIEAVHKIPWQKDDAA